LFPVFLAKWNILGALAGESVGMLIATLFFLLLAAIGLAYFFIRMFSQDGGGQIPAFRTPLSMKLPIILTLLMLLVLGLYVPGWLNHTLNAIVSSLGI
jgi:hydrogenase-4 component F